MNEVIHIIHDFNLVSLHAPTPKVLESYKHIPEINGVDNRGYPICRPLFSHSDIPTIMGGRQIHLQDFDFSTPFYYSATVHHDSRLWAKNIDVLPEVILEQVRKKNCTLIFDDRLEGNTLDVFISVLYESIRKLRLPYSQIIYITNNLFAEHSHDKWKAANMQQQEFIKVISFMWNVYDVQRLKAINLPRSINVAEEIRYKKDYFYKVKPFLKVNRTDRVERNLFMLFLNKEGILDRFALSFPSFPNYTYPSRFDQYTEGANIGAVKKKVPFDIDETDKLNKGEPGLGPNKFDADLPFQAIHYSNTLISVVMCAFPFDDNACHLHSSTFNPMYCGHPVIQFGPYRHLEELRKRGFKTFDKWWDESYDNEPDHWTRLELIMKLVRGLSQLDKEALLDIVEDMREVLQHNSDLINTYDVKTHLIDRILYE